MQHRMRWSAALTLAVGLWAAAPMWAADAAAAEPSAADVQWVQTILKEKGLYSGPLRGDFNPQTKAALTAWQKSVGIKATGTLDQATLDRLMGERKAAATMGNLAKPGLNPNNPRPASRNVEHPKPLAAPTRGVESSGGPQGTAALGSIERNAPMAPPTGSHNSRTTAGAVAAGAVTGALSHRVLDDSAPTAAPRGAVEAVGGPASDDSSGGWFQNGLTAPAWVRTLVIAVLAATLATAAGLWWLSGRRPSKRRGEDGLVAVPERRREPTFESAGKGRGGNGPTLRGTRLS
jgi:peptidoglycan hydrolase-like protein with peptidoglycan-binding domain